MVTIDYLIWFSFSSKLIFDLSHKDNLFVEKNGMVSFRPLRTIVVEAGMECLNYHEEDEELVKIPNPAWVSQVIGWHFPTITWRPYRTHETHIP